MLSAFIPVVAIFFAQVVAAIAFTTLFYPIYRWLHAHCWKNRPLASLMCVLLFCVLLLIPGFILIWLVIGQITEIYAQAQPYIEGLINKGGESRIGQWFLNSPFSRLMEIQHINWRAIIENTAQAVASWGSRVVQRTTAGVFGIIIDLLIILFTMFYLFIDGERLINYVRFLMPVRPEYKEIFFSRFIGISGATIVGTVIIGLLQGIAGALTLLIFGVGSWLLWGAVMVVIAIIPLLGPPIVLVPAGIIKIIMGDVWQANGILLSSFTIVSGIDSILRPRMVGAHAHLHDLIIFFSTLGGLGLFGILGLIVGPALAALTMAALEVVKRAMNPVLEAFAPNE